MVSDRLHHISKLQVSCVQLPDRLSEPGKAIDAVNGTSFDVDCFKASNHKRGL
jgi:hypothetical protein